MKHLEKTYHSATFSTINPTLSDLVLNLSRRCNKPPLTALAVPHPMRTQDKIVIFISDISKVNNDYK
jgi:hypothetical protein